METVTESTDFTSGSALWDWIVYSNPIVDEILGSLRLSNAEMGTVQQALDVLVDVRKAGGRVARLTNPVHVGIGRK